MSSWPRFWSFAIAGLFAEAVAYGAVYAFHLSWSEVGFAALAVTWIAQTIAGVSASFLVSEIRWGRVFLYGLAATIVTQAAEFSGVASAGLVSFFLVTNLSAPIPNEAVQPIMWVSVCAGFLVVYLSFLWLVWRWLIPGPRAQKKKMGTVTI